MAKYCSTESRFLTRRIGASDELCEPNPQGERWAFPLRGQWNANGDHISDKGFTLTCSGGAQGKCVRFGYKPWRTLPNGTSLADYHQACIRLVRADYCGDRGTTRDGMLIDIYDRIGIQRPENNDSKNELSFEAAWNTKGAVCVAHTRVPANMTLSLLATTCPRLRNRLGATACTQEKAESFAFGKVLLYNSSK
jgi:ADYC domain